MAKYSLGYANISFSAGTTPLTTNTFVALQGGNSTMRLQVSEVYIGGEAASASSPSYMLFARSGTLGVGALTGASTSNVLTDASAVAPGTTAATGTTYATTQPTRGNVLLRLSYNAYGGIVRWVASPDQMISVAGNATANASDVTLSAFTGSTTVTASGHILYELV
jgi:hypothetical protein